MNETNSDISRAIALNVVTTLVEMLKRDGAITEAEGIEALFRNPDREAMSGLDFCDIHIRPAIRRAIRKLQENML